MQKIESGVGRVVLRSHGSDAVFSELSYKYPLKLLSPQIHEKKTAVLYVLSYGGGLVGGDTVRLSVEVYDASVLVMLTQVGFHMLSEGVGVSECREANQVITLFLYRDQRKCSERALDNASHDHTLLLKPTSLLNT